MVSYDYSERFMKKWDINLKVEPAFWTSTLSSDWLYANTFTLGLFISSVSKLRNPEPGLAL